MLIFFALAGAMIYASLASSKNESASQDEEDGAEQAAAEASAEGALATGPADSALAPTPEAMAAAFDKSRKVALVGVGLAAAGTLFFPPLGILSVPFILYNCVPLFKRAYHAVVEERRPRAVILDAVATIGALLAQYYLICALSIWILLYFRRLLLRTEDRTRQKLFNILGKQPSTVWVMKDGVELLVPFSQLMPGDLVVITGGEVVPIDGVIRDGVASIDQHMLTGESQLAEKGSGDRVFASTMVLGGRICVEVESIGALTVAAKIGATLDKTTDYRDEIQSRGERLSDKSVLPIAALGTLGLVARGPIGAVTILSSNFISMMRGTIPLAMLNYLTLAMEDGILVKDGRALELLAGVDTVVFDKTGTLTLDTPHVGEIHVCNGMSADALLIFAAAAEAKQTHPIARAIVQTAAERNLSLPAVEQNLYQVGYGIQASITGRTIRVGSARFMAMEGIFVPEAIQQKEAAGHELGHSLVYVAVDQQLGGALELRPTVRAEIPEVVKALRGYGVKLYIISGDHEVPTRHLATELGIDHYFAGVLPEAKADLVTKLKQEGRKVCFVGDGINDVIALKTANASVSLSGATSVATDNAQVVLLDGTLQKLPQLFKLAHDFEANARVSMITAIGPEAICIAGVFLFNFGLSANLVLWNISVIAGFANAMRPALKQKKKAESDRTSAQLEAASR